MIIQGRLKYPGDPRLLISICDLIRNADKYIFIGSYNISRINDYHKGIYGYHMNPVQTLIDKVKSNSSILTLMAMSTPRTPNAERLYYMMMATGIPVFVTGNFHAKFVETDQGNYYGSANMSFGLVRNFESYVMLRPLDKLTDNSVTMKIMRELAQVLLGKRRDPRIKLVSDTINNSKRMLERIIDGIATRYYNPRFDLLEDDVAAAYNEVQTARSEFYQLPGYKLKKKLQIDAILVRQEKKIFNLMNAASILFWLTDVEPKMDMELEAAKILRKPSLKWLSSTLETVLKPLDDVQEKLKGYSDKIEVIKDYYSSEEIALDRSEILYRLVEAR